MKNVRIEDVYDCMLLKDDNGLGLVKTKLHPFKNIVVLTRDKFYLYKLNLKSSRPFYNIVVL